jgi:hypothetical protein
MLLLWAHPPLPGEGLRVELDEGRRAPCRWRVQILLASSDQPSPEIVR